MSDSREEILLRELERHGWRKGDAAAVTLELSEESAYRPDLTIAFVVAAQLLGRMSGTVRSLRLVAPVTTPPAIARLLRARGQLDRACTRAIERAGCVPVIGTAVPGAMRIMVGRPTIDAGVDLWFDADGWLALIGTGEGRPAPGAPVGAVVAACLTVNELFQLVHAALHVTPRRYAFSAWDMHVAGARGPDRNLAGLELGAVNLAGAGAVAMCALWTAAAAEVALAVRCGDHDVVDGSNLARLPFADLADVGRAKVEILKEGLARSSVVFDGEARRFEELGAPMDRPLLFAVDDDQARATLQQLAPVLAISATTGGLALTIEWSDLDPTHACISCGHPIQMGPSPDELAATFGIGPDELAGKLTPERLSAIEQTRGLEPGTLDHLVDRPACDELNELARIALGIGGPTGSVAFLSWLAGALLLVEVIAHTTAQSSSRPRRAFLPLIAPAAVRTKDPKPRPACSCEFPFFKEAYAAARRDQVRAIKREQAIPFEETEVVS